MKQKPIKVTDQVRKIIENCGVSCHKISQDTGIDKATLSRFMGHKGGLSNPILDRLGEYLGLRIVTDQASKTKGK